MNRDLSKIVSGIFSGAKPGEDLSPRFQRLKDQLKEALEGDATVIGTFRGLVASFREVIPDEQQRYQAALTALSTTLKQGPQEIVKVLDGQIAELKAAEKGLLSSLPGRDALNALEAKAEAIRAERAKLQEKIALLENEEKTVLASKAGREKEWAAIDRAVGDLFANAAAEMASVRKKMEELSGEGRAPATPPPPKAPVKRGAPEQRTEEAKEPVGQAPAAPIDPKYQRKCPMCGGQFNLLELENLWQCFSCAYEEPADGARGSR